MPTKADGQLSMEQLNAIELLITGRTDAAVAEIVGVTRPTVCEWRNKNPRFAATLNRRRQEAWGANADRLRSLGDEAVKVLESGLKSTNDPRLQQNAAIHILRATGLYGLQAPEGPATPDGIEQAWALKDILG
jgi:hypothetical protein